VAAGARPRMSSCACASPNPGLASPSTSLAIGTPLFLGHFFAMAHEPRTFPGSYDSSFRMRANLGCPASRYGFLRARIWFTSAKGTAPSCKHESFRFHQSFPIRRAGRELLASPRSRAARARQFFNSRSGGHPGSRECSVGARMRAQSFGIVSLSVRRRERQSRRLTIGTQPPTFDRSAFQPVR